MIRAGVACSLCLLTLLAIPASAKDMAGLYSDEELARWKGKLESLISSTREAVGPALIDEGRRRVTAARLDIPLRPLTGDPFDYLSCWERNVITVPVISVKLLHDLVYADLWLAHNGYEGKSHLYVDMLRRRNAAEFVGGRFPRPSEALGIPESVLEEPSKNGPLAQQFRSIVHSALLFLVAHEAAHIVLRHPCRESAEEEVEADIMAYEILIRNRGNVAGLTKYFTLVAFWARGAPPRTSHPVTSKRLLNFGALLHGEPENYVPDFPDSKTLVAATRSLGFSLARLSEKVEELAAAQDLRKLTVADDMAALRPEKSRSLPKNDGLFELVLMSEFWWGTPIDQFPIVAGLKANEYTRLDHPVRPGVKVIMPITGEVTGGWRTTPLNAMSFEFTSDGLREISGMLGNRLTQAEAIALVRERFGEPSKQQRALDMVSYFWILDKSVVAITPLVFSLTPR